MTQLDSQTDRPAPAAKLLERTQIVAGQQLRVFVESPHMIDALLRDIESAQSRVWIECYIIVDDAAGQAVARALKDRAAAGVDVRLLYDAVGSQSTRASFFNDLSASGVHVHAFHSIWEAIERALSLRLWQTLNRRNHRKLTVIDDQIAYFGGMNIVDLRDQTDQQQKKVPHSAGWRDVHVRLEGSQQAELAESFDRSWRRAHRQPVSRRSRSYRNAALGRDAQDSIRFFDTGPGRRYTRAARVFLRLIDRSKRRLLLSMAYFLPPGRILRRLVRARRRGVIIDVVVPAESDVKLVQWATQHLYAICLRHDLRIYERQQRMLHSKVMIADDEWTVIGSCNLDARSLLINLELFAVIRSRTFAHTVSQICAEEIAESHCVTCDTHAKRSWWQRLRNRVAYSLRAWL